MRPVTSCPACAAPVSPRAVTCALCDHVIAPARIAAAARAADRRSSREAAALRGWRDLGRPIGTALLLPVLAIGIGAAVFGFVTVGRAQDDAATWGAEAPRRLAAIGEAWPAIEEAARRAAAPVRRAGMDRAAFRELVAATTPPDAVRRAPGRLAAFDVDTTAWARYGTPDLGRLASGVALGAGVRTDLPVQLTDEMRQRFVADTATPWLAVWRRAATSAEPPAAWQYRVGAPRVDGPLRAPALGLGLYKALGWTNAEAALLLLERGRRDDGVAAVQRARENVAMAHVLARSPIMIEHLVGRVLLREGAALLAFAGERTGDSVAVADGVRLGQAADRLRGVDVMAGPRAVDWDGAVQAALALAADRRLPPAIRASAGPELMVATCLAPRQVVLGPSPALRASLRDASARLADVDPEYRVRPAIARGDVEWDALTRGGEWRRTRQHVPAWADVAGAIGLGGLTGRAMACAER